MDLSASARTAPAPREREAARWNEKTESPPDREDSPQPARGLPRAVDVFLALVLIVVTAPLLVAAMGTLALTAGRPVLFGHRRLGQGGRVFRCWKLRTMRVDAEKVLALRPGLRRLHRRNGFKLPASRDPRIVRGGRWLRKSHLDELPQLFNVLAGDMSLVGPRPIVADELELFGRDARTLLSVRPGIFGAWTSLGRRRPPYPERARIEVDWVRRRSARRDVAILLRSVGVVLRGQQEG